jgi:hypothetical protein
MLRRVPELPLREEDLTPAWLSGALRRDVTAISETGAIRGTGTKIFLDVKYADGDDAGPSSVCVKGGFGEQVRSFGLGEAYVLEATFYGEVAPR